LAPVPAVGDDDRVGEVIEVTGVVQGVGFRPFVHRLATELGLTGTVANTTTHVEIEVRGSATTIDALVRRLRNEAPPLAWIESVTRRPDAGPTGDGFVIIDSASKAGSKTVVPPDTAVCDECLAEMREPSNRRFGHPFITCTNCGPRYTIITDLPYDRPNTTMAGFELCAQCQAEYDDPTDRRHHAQPIGCHRCGPTLHYRSADGMAVVGGDGVAAAAEALGRGEVVAIKGLGGFHFACDATNGETVAGLRLRKHRPDKPFAVMVSDLSMARQLAVVSQAEASLLTSPARPVVLVEARSGDEVTAAMRPTGSVAPASPLIGIMLAYTPTHHLLFDALARRGRSVPLVMTSANVAGEPIIHRDDDIESVVGPIADALLTNDRPIATPCDDSVVRALHRGDGGDGKSGGDGNVGPGRSTLLPVRRARGYAPIPVTLGEACSGHDRREGETILATGGELKNTFCLVDGERAWISQHIGDMGTLATLSAYERTVDRFRSAYSSGPSGGVGGDKPTLAVAVDCHPGYAVSRWARRVAAGPVMEVQHHHAHVASVMAEHRLDPDQPVIGFAFDGTGYGTDGTIWGGEVLLATAADFVRVAHLAPVPLPGGDAAVEHPARVALSHLRAAGIEWSDDLAPVAATGERERLLLDRQLTTEFGCVPTTSMGRLFDAVSSILGVRHHISYEAQAAIELEYAARTANVGGSDRRHYRFAVDRPAPGGGPIVFHAGPLLSDIVADRRRGLPVGAIADGFHRAVAALVVDLVATLTDGQPGDRDDVRPVVLSGGVFQNALLTELTLDRLERAGRSVYTNRMVPPNDGGLSLGQALIARHQRRPTEQTRPKDG
jgi:hydrogenase maturation protein HypF